MHSLPQTRHLTQECTLWRAVSLEAGSRHCLLLDAWDPPTQQHMQALALAKAISGDLKVSKVRPLPTLYVCLSSSLFTCDICTTKRARLNQLCSADCRQMHT